MKLIELKCKNCHAKLEINPELNEYTCKYCDASFKVDDEVKHIRLDDMEQKGYEFEMGRVRAQRENQKKTIQKEKYFLACNGMDIFVSNNDNLLYSKVRQNREEKEIYYNNYFVDYIFYD